MLSLFFLLFSILDISASEIDHFTRRFEYLPDSSSQINFKANIFVTEALEKANLKALRKEKYCREKKLYKELRNYFRNHFNGQLTPYILTSDEISRREISREDSIYQEWTWWDGFLLKKFSAVAPLVRVGDIVIGSDKFEHFFGRGFAYFKRRYLKDKKIKKVLKFGIRGERTIYGGNKLATGIFSYADLVANFNGMRFWNHILAKREDILGKQLGPYITCQKGLWVQIKEIDFRLYFDDGFDEAINCSKFASKKTTKKVIRAIARLNTEDPDHDYTCPMDKKKLDNILKKYGNYSKWLINTDGHQKYKKKHIK